MDAETAFNLIEAYLQKRATLAEYQAALNFLQTDPGVQVGLGRLYQDLTRPGGLDHETARELMLVYLDPLAREEMKPAERNQFLLHLTQCRECAEEYLELSNFEQALASDENLVIPRFKAPAPASKTAVPWPERWETILTQIRDTARSWQASLRFSPEAAVREEGISYNPAPPKTPSQQLTLFDEITDSALELELSIYATRQGPSDCRVTVQLQGPELQRHPAGHNILLRLDQTTLRQATDRQGQASFAPIPVAALSQLQFDISVNL